MSSTNQSPQYQKAESKFLGAQTDEERLTYLDEMIRECPKHKSSEKMLANLKTRRIKLMGKMEKEAKTRRSSRSGTGIKKEEMQAAIIGFTNSGKSSLLNLLTNTGVKISSGEFSKYTTKEPQVGVMFYSGIGIQIIEIPSPESQFYDKGLANSADVILILINSLEEIEKLKKYLEKSSARKMIVYNKSDLLNPPEKRKLEATLKSKKYDFVLISTKTKENISELKEKIFRSFGKIRVYTKEPGKQKSDKPIVLSENSTIYNVAEKIFHGFSKQVKESFVTGPSSKFPNQKVGLKHKLKDLDVVEFRTR